MLPSFEVVFRSGVRDALIAGNGIDLGAAGFKAYTFQAEIDNRLNIGRQLAVGIAV